MTLDQWKHSMRNFIIDAGIYPDDEILQEAYEGSETHERFDSWCNQSTTLDMYSKRCMRLFVSAWQAGSNERLKVQREHDEWIQEGKDDPSGGSHRIYDL